MKKFLFLISTLLLISPAYAQNYFEQGKTEFYKKNYFLAQNLFLQELQQNPENYACRYFLAHSYIYNGDISKGKEEYNKIITFSPVDSIKRLAMQSLYNLNQTENKTNSSTITTDLSDNYYKHIKLKDNYVKWAIFPINVYVSPCDEAVIIKNAFIKWEKATNGLVSFNFVGNIASAKITVSTVDKLATDYKEGFEAGLATIKARNNIIYKSHIDILKTNPLTQEKFDENMILTTSMHEIGHALGIQGHSPSDADLMSAINHKGLKNLTKRDLNTIIMLYRQ